jgi:hypothetical protein
MNLFAIIFAVLMLSLFWGGFAFMLFYSLKLKPGQDSSDDETE